jgi:hypothetical protein
MNEATEDDAFGGYDFAIRTFYFQVTGLQVNRVWSRESLRKKTPEFFTSISGKATSEDRVGVIGSEGSVKEYDFTLRVNTDAKESWEWHKRINGLLSTDHPEFKPEHIRLKQLIEERLDESPPTAALGTDDGDWELGTRPSWWIECMVPPEVLSKIEDEITAKTVSSIYMGVKWEAGLVFDRHAPPSFPTTWGMFRLGADRSPELMQGHVSLVKWSPTSHEKEKTEHIDKERPDNDFPAGTPAPSPVLAPPMFNMPKSVTIALWIIALATVLDLFK